MKKVMLEKPKLILGEGQDEVKFFGALLKHLKINDVQPLEYGGKNGIEAGLASIVDLSGFQTVVSIGITRDADHFDNPASALASTMRNRGETQAAFERICNVLGDPKINLPVPTALLEKASADGKPAVQVFILPDCALPGMLEDLCLSSVVTEPGFPCVDEYFACLERETKFTHLIHKLPKARIRVWLANQTEPDLRLGEAAEKGYWNFDHPAFDKLKQFLQSL